MVTLVQFIKSDDIGGVRSTPKIQSKERMFDINNIDRTTAQPPETYKMVRH